jgi:hypothetical protein
MSQLSDQVKANTETLQSIIDLSKKISDFNGAQNQNLGNGFLFLIEDKLSGEYVSIDELQLNSIIENKSSETILTTPAHGSWQRTFKNATAQNDVFHNSDGFISETVTPLDITFTTSNSRFTFFRSGKYLINVSVFYDRATAVQHTFNVFKNGVNISQSLLYGGSDAQLHFCKILDILPGDYLTFALEDNSGIGFEPFIDKGTSFSAVEITGAGPKGEDGQGVVTVTGTNVDNTDPLNPVVNAPLATTSSDGEMSSIDKTKLDGIESLADVTDTANVTGAGALMDSEVTNLAQVKSFDATDYASSAQGLLADNALQNLSEDTTPQLGGELDLNGHSIGGNAQAATGSGTTTIDWKLGNIMLFQFGAFNETFVFTPPTKPGVYILRLVQDSVGSRTAIFHSTVKWMNGNAPTLTTTPTNGKDYLTFIFDGTNYDGVESLNFS